MKTVLLFLFIMSVDMHSLRFHLVIELPRIPAYYPKIVIIRVRMQNFCI